jgi:hypothetical protein
MGAYYKAKQSIRRWLLRRLPPCKDTVVVISESMERPLALRERVLLKLHLWICSWCQWYMEHLLTIRGTLRTQSASEANLNSVPGLSAEARERIKQKLSGE